MSPGTWRLVLPNPFPDRLFLIPGGEKNKNISGLDTGIPFRNHRPLPSEAAR